VLFMAIENRAVHDTVLRDATARAMTSTAVRARPQLSAPEGNGTPRVADPPYERTERLPFGLQQGLFLALLGIIVLVRLTHITYNTLFVDEAIYATVGQDVLQGVFKQNATTFMFGSYLYPTVAAIASDIGGVVGLRGLSALLSTVTAVFVYLTTLRLFGKQAALWAMAIFGLTGISISLGQLAVYDSLAAPLVAASLYCLVMGPWSRSVTPRARTGICWRRPSPSACRSSPSTSPSCACRPW